jgi:hypothetical protein
MNTDIDVQSFASMVSGKIAETDTPRDSEIILPRTALVKHILASMCLMLGLESDVADSDSNSDNSAGYKSVMSEGDIVLNSMETKNVFSELLCTAHLSSISDTKSSSDDESAIYTSKQLQLTVAIKGINKCIVLAVFESTTVRELSERAFSICDIPCGAEFPMRFVYAGKYWDGHNTLSEIGVSNSSYWEVNLLLRGGASLFLWVLDLEGRKLRLQLENDELSGVSTIQQLSCVLSNFLKSSQDAKDQLQWCDSDAIIVSKLPDGTVDEICNETRWTYEEYVGECMAKQLYLSECPLLLTQRSCSERIVHNSESLAHTISVSVLLNPSSELSGDFVPGNDGLISASLGGQIGVSNLDPIQNLLVEDSKGRRAEFTFIHGELFAVQTTGQLSLVLSEFMRSNPDTKKTLLWPNDNLVLVKKMPDGRVQELCEDSPWQYSPYHNSCRSSHSILPLFIARKGEALNSLGGIYSEASFVNFTGPSFYKCERRRRPTLLQCLNLESVSKKRKKNPILAHGIRLTSSPAQPDALNVICSSEIVANTSRSGWYTCEFPKFISVDDLGLSSECRDGLMDDGRSLAVHRLHQFLQNLERQKCFLNSGIEGRRICIDDESGEKAPSYVRIMCGTVKCRCTHTARFAYVPIPPGGRYALENKSVPVFKLVSGTSQHSCNQAIAVLEFSGQKRGKSKWSPLDVEKAIWLSTHVSFQDIVEAFGVNTADVSLFNGRVAHLMSRVRKSLSEKRQSEHFNLTKYVDLQIATGYTSYYIKEELPDSADGQKRLRVLWMRSSQLYFLKKGLANVTSLDFVYKLSQGLFGAFGHFCILGPEKTIIPVAQFLVESENASAMDWIIKHFREAHRCFQIKFQHSAILHDDAPGHKPWLRNAGNHRPTLQSRMLVLEADGTQQEFVYFCHAENKEILCLAPPHVPASWKVHLGRLPISDENRDILERRIWSFALKTHICSLHELDAEWEEMTESALRMEHLPELLCSYSLPEKLRLGVAAMGVPHLVQGDVHDLPEISNLVKQASAETLERLKSCQDPKSLESMQFKLKGLTRAACRSELRAKEITSLIESVQDISEEIRKIIEKSSTSQSKTRIVPVCQSDPAQCSQPSAASIRESVIAVMQKIYKKAPFWCQRITCMGFTMGAKASSWSEALNSAIRKLVPIFLTAKRHYGLDSFVKDIDDWVDRLCERAYTVNQSRPKPPKRSELIPQERSELQSVLSNAAVDAIESLALGGGTDERWTFSAERKVELCDVPVEMQNSVNMICKKYGIELSEFRYFQPRSKVCSSPSLADPKTWNEMVDAASKRINALNVPIVAVHFPSSECLIPCLKRCKAHGFVLFCSCQRQTATGLPCTHQLAWILDRESRSMKNIVWLCHPTFIRGHDVSSMATGVLLRKILLSYFLSTLIAIFLQVNRRYG